MKDQKQLTKNFIAGILILLPLWLTIFVVVIFTKWVSGIARPFVSVASIYIFGIENEFFIRVVSFFCSLGLIYLIGLLANNVFGKKILKKFETMLLNIPIVRDVYNSAKKLVSFIFEYNTYKWDKVILVEYPRKEIYSIGIITLEDKGSNKVGVFIPSTPNPTTGFFVFVDKKDIITTQLTIEEALKVIVSGGVIGAESLEKPLYETKQQK